MKEDAIKHIHTIGRVGVIIANIYKVLIIVLTLIILAGTVGLFMIPKDLLTLLLFLLLAFFIGLVLRPLLMNLNHLFDKRLAETDLMLGETATGELSRPQLTLMMKTMMQDKEGRADFILHANRFEKRYPKLIRTGFILILVIPLIFLILMFSLESKIVFLTLWIISIIAISVWLIVVEYIHTKLEEQKELAGMSYEEMLENFRGKEAE